MLVYDLGLDVALAICVSVVIKLVFRARKCEHTRSLVNILTYCYGPSICNMLLIGSKVRGLGVLTTGQSDRGPYHCFACFMLNVYTIVLHDLCIATGVCTAVVYASRSMYASCVRFMCTQHVYASCNMHASRSMYALCVCSTQHARFMCTLHVYASCVCFTQHARFTQHESCCMTRARS